MGVSFIFSLQNFFNKNKKVVVSILIFLIIICLLGIPFLNWGFLHDDFGVVWHSQINSWQDFLRLFYDSGMTVAVQPSNYVVPEQTFFNVYYRPLVYAFYALQMKIFGFWPYGYFLTTIFLHAINSVILFNIFLFFVPYIWAFWAAMYFAFHPSLCNWLGWIAGQAHILNYLFILFVLLTFKKYLDSRKIFYYLIACFLLLMSLFIRETAMFLPLWLIYAVYLYEKHMGYISGNFFKNLRRSFLSTIGFWFVTIFYFVVRISFYPLSTAGGSQLELNPIKFLISFKDRFFHLVTFVSDVFGLSFLPGGHRILKGSMILLYAFIFIWSVVKNKKKKFLIFLAVSMIMIMWPAVLRYYSSRYLYKALPFYLLIVLFLIHFYDYGSVVLKEKFHKFSLSMAYFFLIFNTIFLVLHLKKREVFLHRLNTAFVKLAQNSKIQNKPLCFVGLPWSFFPTGVAQGMWIYGYNKLLPVYYDRRTWGFSLNPIFKNYLKIETIKNGFRIKSKNPDKLWLAAWGQQELAMGKKVVNKSLNGNVIDASFIFEEKYLKQKPIFISWDYEKLKFVMLK